MNCDRKVMCSVGKALFCLGYDYELVYCMSGVMCGLVLVK